MSIHMQRYCVLSLGLFFCLCSGLSAGYADNVITDAPVAWWRFGDYFYKDGFAAEDATGHVTGATFQGDAMIVSAGIDTNCGWFNGNQAGIDLANELGPMLNGSSAISIELWFRNSTLPADGVIQRIFATRINSGAAGIDIGIVKYTDGTSYLRVYGRSHWVGDSYLGANAPFSSVDQWTHAVCIFDYAEDKIRVYLNGNLSVTQPMNFVSGVYVYGVPTQRDQIGRTPDNKNHFRGWIDEVAVYAKALTEAQIQAHYSSGVPQDAEALWVSQVADEGAAEGPFLSSPYLHKFANGVILASYDYFGANRPVPTGTAIIKISYDNGQTWWPRGQVSNVVGGTLFEHNGVLYHLGVGSRYITIAKSLNYGSTWTLPTNNTNGMLFSAGTDTNLAYEGISMPVLFANGRIYRVFHHKNNSQAWPVSFATVMISADLNSDLLNAGSWTITNAVPFDPAWAAAWGSNNPGWLEGNAVQAPDGRILAIVRVDSDPEVDKAAILTLSSDNTTLSFDPATGFIDLPGGRNKFNITRDAVTGKYLTLSNNNTDPTRPEQRNTLSLIASDDLIHWEHVRTLIQDNSPMSWEDSMINAGFQYVAWEFDGSDILYISRTAYDGAANYHDSNKITFHRLEQYLDFVAPCGQWGYLSGDGNRDCVVNMLDLLDFLQQWLENNELSDFSELAHQWLECTQPYGEGCIYGSF